MRKRDICGTKRGHGLASVAYSVDSYGGEMSGEQRHGEFTVTVKLPLSQGAGQHPGSAYRRCIRQRTHESHRLLVFPEAVLRRIWFVP